MKLLLTSAGIRNASIENALRRAARQADCRVQCALHPHRVVRPLQLRRGLAVRLGQLAAPDGPIGLEVARSAGADSAPEPRPPELWLPLVEEVDGLLAGGGDAAYLGHWLRESGLADLMPSLRETVWVGLSAGSMALTPRIGAGLRQLADRRCRRPDARHRRLLDLPAPRQPRADGKHDGSSRALGSRDREPVVCDRRRHRDQSRRRHGRSRLRRALEAVRLKLLLTSAGVKNPSIQDALVELLGKPIAECDALCIPTALYGHPMAGPRQAWRCISAQGNTAPLVGLGWKSLGVLELTALPSLDKARWVPLVQEADVLLVDGGDAAYLAHWLRDLRAGRSPALARRHGLGRA